MPDLGLILGGSRLAEQHPFTAEDIFAEEGGLLKKRGKVMYAHDFRSGYGGWNPVHNATGGEHPRSPLSIVNYPARALRLSAPGPSLGQGTSTDAILRLERPRALTGLTDGAVVSMSFRYAIFGEYTTSIGSTSEIDRPILESLGFGIDTQSWDNTERQFFTALAKFSDTDVNAETWQLRGSRPNTSTAIQFVNAPAGRGAVGLINGQNENKYNQGYGRITCRYGTNPDYLEMQLGGRTVDLRGITAVNEPIQFGATNTQANFRGGFNPFFSVKLRTDIASALAGGMFITDICVTYGDELA